MHVHRFKNNSEKLNGSFSMSHYDDIWSLKGRWDETGAYQLNRELSCSTISPSLNLRSRQRDRNSPGVLLPCSYDQKQTVFVWPDFHLGMPYPLFIQPPKREQS